MDGGVHCLGVKAAVPSRYLFLDVRSAQSAGLEPKELRVQSVVLIARMCSASGECLGGDCRHWLVPVVRQWLCGVRLCAGSDVALVRGYRES